MIDPYKVLDIPPGAGKEDIKKAYRKKAKEYHPDLHPNDPAAAEKMNEVNEAYDMLNNPEKYKKTEQQEQYRQQSTYGYSGSGQQAGYGNSGGNQYGGGYYNPWGNRGGYSDFEEMFGFHFHQYEIPKPVVLPEDDSQFRAAVEFINMNQYSYAQESLNNVTSLCRNARWYYLSSLANHGLGNHVLSLEQIQKAMQMEPQNTVYRQTYQGLNASGMEYRSAGGDYRSSMDQMGKFCMSYFALQFFCMFCRCC